MLPDDLFNSIPGVLSVDAPKSASVPLVFDSPHSGVQLPKDFHPAVSPEMVLLATDTYVDELFESAPDFGAPLLRALFPRSFLDVNRSNRDVDVEMVESGWPYPVRENAAAKRGMGLTWRYAWGDTLMHDRLLTIPELEARIDTYWAPYHARLVALLDRTYEEHGLVYHVDCHSMPAVGHSLSPDPAGTVRPDFVIGDIDGESTEPEFSAMIISTLESFGYVVSHNVPFKGAELVKRYADPANGRHSLQIEINRRLYMDEKTRARNSGFGPLQADIKRLNQAIHDYVVTKTKSK